MRPNLLPLFSAALCVLSLPSFGGETVSSKQPAISPTIPVDDPWEVTMSMPLWISGVEGTTGVHGFTAETSASFADIIKNVDMVAAATLEVKKGRWGGWIDGMYLKASVGGDTPGPLLNSIGVGIEQVMVETAVFYRAWQSERGFLDLYAGVRYMSVGGELSLGVSNSGVEQVSQQLSQQIVNQVVSAVRSKADAALASARSQISAQVTSAARAGVASTVATKAAGVRTSIANLQQIAAAHPRLVQVLRNSDRLKTAIRNVTEARIDEKLAAAQTVTAAAQTVGSAVRAAAQAAADKARTAAQKAVAKAEKQLAGKIEDALRDAIPAEISQTIDWVDPFVGVRARYNFTDRLYAIAKADIGGFGVSSDLVWNAYGALGCNLTKTGKTTLELGYRYMSVDYTRGGFTYDMATSGPMINLGLKF